MYGYLIPIPRNPHIRNRMHYEKSTNHIFLYVHLWEANILMIFFDKGYVLYDSFLNLASQQKKDKQLGCFSVLIASTLQGAGTLNEPSWLYLKVTVSGKIISDMQLAHAKG